MGLGFGFGFEPEFAASTSLGSWFAVTSGSKLMGNSLLLALVYTFTPPTILLILAWTMCFGPAEVVLAAVAAQFASAISSSETCMIPFSWTFFFSSFSLHFSVITLCFSVILSSPLWPQPYIWLIISPGWVFLFVAHVPMCPLGASSGWACSHCR